ncbi:MAG: hypothetical protein KGJ62_14735 [Armatimonadetes bacterium]|nr:hypothetical protein [Armatimonadota bacterium]MDE2206358.1 hypothetical protein [Armatimonadota bacterium]
MSFIGAFYGIDRARYTNHLASICLYFGSHRSPKDLRNPALRWEPRGYDWALPAMSAEGYLINLYWWQRDRAALAAAFRYWWSGGPSEGRLNDIYDAWRYARSDMLRCAATDYGVARVLADGFYSGGPNNEEAVLPAPTRTLRILRRMGRRHTVVGRGARAVAAALAHELHVYGPPTW